MSQQETGLMVELVKKDRTDWTGYSEEIHTDVKRVVPMKGKIVIQFEGNERDIRYPRDDWEICKVAQEYPHPERM